ncbi:MAG: hypothetical protein JNK35_12645 [Phycisphaerae bacterium]|nr:hypothetical protein [Phycisphaerae bacterium]
MAGYKLVRCCAALVATAPGASPARATVWDAAADFLALGANPNGAWSYGGQPGGVSGAFELYTAFVPRYGWAGGGGVIWVNPEPYGQYGIAPGQMSLHPQSTNAPTIVRWTCPEGESGLAHVEGQFLPGDAGAMQVGVIAGGIFWFQAIDSGAFDLNIPVGPGVTIDFLVYGGYGSGNTGLDARITVGGSACGPDFNGDGNLDPDDLADYIACYFGETTGANPCDRADYDGSTFVDPDDLADYIASYFAGC